MSVCFGLQVLAALFVLVPFCYLSGSFTISPVTEATSQARHLQLLSGCPPLIYWAGFYVSVAICHAAACASHASPLSRRELPLDRLGSPTQTEEFLDAVRCQAGDRL